MSPVSTSIRTSNPRWRISSSRISRAGRERLGRRLGGLEVGPLGGDRAARGRDLGGLVGVQVGRGLGRDRRGVGRDPGAAAGRDRARSSRRGPRSAYPRASAVLHPRTARPAAVGGRSSRGRSSSAGRASSGRGRRARRRARAIVAARSAIVARPVVAASARGRRHDRGRGPRSDRRGPRSSRGGDGGSGLDAAASRFGAAPPRADRGAATIRAGSAPMPRTPRLPGVRISKSSSCSSTPNSSRATAQRLLDGLAGELLVRTHQRRLPRRPWRPRSLWRMVLSACGGSLLRGPAERRVRRSGLAGRPAAAGDREARGVVLGEARGPAEQREHPAPADDQVLLDDREEGRRDPVEEQAGRQEAAVDQRDEREDVRHLALDPDVAGRRPSPGRATGSAIRDWTSWSSAEMTASRLRPDKQRSGGADDDLGHAPVDAERNRVEARVGDVAERR